jgi:hypothetical protein
LIQKKHLEDVKGLNARFRGYVISQEIKESAGDCDFAAVASLAVDDDHDHLDDSDDPSDEEEPQNQLNDSRDGPSVEEFAEPGNEEQNHTIQYLVHFVHIRLPPMLFEVL